jgi:hypothetical protein
LHEALGRASERVRARGTRALASIQDHQS